LGVGRRSEANTKYDSYENTQKHSITNNRSACAYRLLRDMNIPYATPVQYATGIREGFIDRKI